MPRPDKEVTEDVTEVCDELRFKVPESPRPLLRFY